MFSSQPHVVATAHAVLQCHLHYLSAGFPQFECHAVLLQEEAKSLKYPLARDYLNYVKWRITVHFKKLDNPKVSVLLKLVILLFLATWSLTWSRPASSDTTKFE